MLPEMAVQMKLSINSGPEKRGFKRGCGSARYGIVVVFTVVL